MKSNLNTIIPIRPHPHHASRLKPKCWLIGDRAGNFPTAAAEIARLRGIETEACPIDGGYLPTLLGAPGQLIAISLDLLTQLSPEEKLRMRRWVERGATVYVRGPIKPGRKYSMRPLADVEFDSVIQPSLGYRFTAHWILPVAIAREGVAEIARCRPVALGLSNSARPLLTSTHPSGEQSPIIFAAEVGAGVIICDLSEEIADLGTPLISRLSDPASRTAIAGTLAALDYAAGRDASLSAPINLVLDDRPINHDFFNGGRTEKFLKHIDSQCPGIHIDFAWTPNQTRVNRAYVETLRRYNTGYVWHGLLRHMDHSTIMDLETDLSIGRSLIREISKRYDIEIQPVMIFPYEKDNAACVALLRRADYVARVQSFDPDPKAVPRSYFRLRSAQTDTSAGASFATLLRDSVEMLNRNRMLALATLGMPIIALAHPNNLGVQRLRPTREPMGPSYFDRIVKFAAEKSLRPMSLEHIACEMPVD